MTYDNDGCEADAAAGPQDEWSRNMQSLRELEKLASKLPRESRGACDVAIAAVCANIAQSTGLMFQSSALAMQQQMMTAQASTVKGIVEVYRARPLAEGEPVEWREANRRCRRGSASAAPSNSEMNDLLMSMLGDSETPPPPPGEENGGHG